MRGPPDGTKHPGLGRRRSHDKGVSQITRRESDMFASRANALLATLEKATAEKEGQLIRFVTEVRTQKPCDDHSCGARAAIVAGGGDGKVHMITLYSYALPDGTATLLQHGDVFWEECRGCSWTNCQGSHLVCVLSGQGRSDSDRPYLHHWNIDGRASNCSMPNDKEHRCWIRTGSPEAEGSLHVSKAGKTCAAGAGSIAIPGFHGFLHHGRIIEK